MEAFIGFRSCVLSSLITFLEFQEQPTQVFLVFWEASHVRFLNSGEQTLPIGQDLKFLIDFMFKNKFMKFFKRHSLSTTLYILNYGYQAC